MFLASDCDLMPGPVPMMPTIPDAVLVLVVDSEAPEKLRAFRSKFFSAEFFAWLPIRVSVDSWVRAASTKKLVAFVLALELVTLNVIEVIATMLLSRK